MITAVCSHRSRSPFCCMCEQIEKYLEIFWGAQVKGTYYYCSSHRHSSSNMWAGLPVKLSSHATRHSDEAPPGDETWHLPQA